MVDTETSGLDPRENALLTVGYCIIELQPRVQYDVIHTGCVAMKSSGLKITQKAMAVNGIDIEKHDRTADTPERALSIFLTDLKQYFGNSRPAPIMHNAAFDIGFLRQWFSRCGLEYDDYFSRRSIDTYTLLASLHAAGKIHLKNFGLGSAASYFNIPAPGKLHDALNDALVTAGLYKAMLEVMA